MTRYGIFKTAVKLTLENIKLQQFTTERTMTIEMDLFERANNDHYNFNLGRNLLQDTELDIKISARVYVWEKIKILMVPREH